MRGYLVRRKITEVSTTSQNETLWPQGRKKYPILSLVLCFPDKASPLAESKQISAITKTSFAKVSLWWLRAWQEMMENGLGGRGRGMDGYKMAFQNKGIMFLKDEVLSPFLSKQSSCLFLIDFFSWLPHIKTLRGVLARAASTWKAEGIKWY